MNRAEIVRRLDALEKKVNGIITQNRTELEIERVRTKRDLEDLKDRLTIAEKRQKGGKIL